MAVVTQAEEKARLSELLRRRSVRIGEVVLASGRASGLYIDVKQTIFTADGFALAGRLLYGLVRQTGTHCIGGMATGAIPLVAAVLAASLEDRTYELTGFFVRPSSKDHGLGKQIEGCFDPRHPVAILEDVVTTARSALTAVEAVRAASGICRHVIALVDREEGGRAALEAAGCQLLAVFGKGELT